MELLISLLILRLFLLDLLQFGLEILDFILKLLFDFPQLFILFLADRKFLFSRLEFILEFGHVFLLNLK